MCKILDFGSLNLDKVYRVQDIVREGETISSLELRTYPGGKGLNQAIALARAGAQVYMAGGLGLGGEELKASLDSSGVNTSFLEERDVESGHAIIQVDSKGRNCIVIYPGSNYGNTQDYIDAVLRAFSPGDYILLQNEIDQIDKIIQAAKVRGLYVVFNPSPMNERILSLDLSQIDIFLLNEHEAKAILERDINAKQDKYSSIDGDAIIALLHEQFPGAKIVLTLGEQGSLFVDKTGEVYRQTAYLTQTVDTTAAGDTFTGYFLASLLSGADYREALEKAAIASGLSVSREGAAPSIPFYPEVDTIYSLL